MEKDVLKNEPKNLPENKNDIEIKMRKKTRNDKIVSKAFLILALISASFIVIIVLFILIRGMTPFFKKYEVNGEYHSVSFWRFLFGNEWFVSPNVYGVGFVIINTFYVTILSLILAVPMSILTALFIDRIAPKVLAKILSTSVELLASIPSVIYGVFGMGIITSMVKGIANVFNIQTAGGSSILSMVIVLALMIYPTITTVSVTAIHAVKKNMVEGSLALGASKTQTNFKVVLTSAKSGIFAGVILGVGRALGEATAVSMVCTTAGSGPNFNIFKNTRTLTTTILNGIHETQGMDYDIRFSVGIILIVVILITNLLLNLIKKRIGRLE